MQPGNLSALLNELPSARIQSSAPGLGGVGLQLRGIPTRHTLVLSDGLPLLGSAPDEFGLLQTPPLDLQRIELIKGAATALYGGSSLGGVLNILSKSPDAEPALLANISSRGGRDVEGFLTAQAASHLSGTLTAGAHDQSREDINRDGWADLPAYRRYTLRPRLWWDLGSEHSLFLTAGITEENRSGGTLPGAMLPSGGSFAEALHTRRLDGGAVDHWPLEASGLALTGRLSVSSADFDRTFGTQRIASNQTTIYAEEALGGETGVHAWAAGAALVHDELAVPTVTGIGFSYNVPALFVQDEVQAAGWLKLAGAARLDHNNRYGTYLSPRLSALFRQPERPWSLRASAGSGFAAPTLQFDEIEAVGFGPVAPLRGLRVERATTESLDGKWESQGWDVNLSLFNSEIRSPLQVQPLPLERLELINAAAPRRAPGAEVLVHYVTGALQMIGSWSYIHATELAPGGERVPAELVPQHSAELGGILESERRGRVGLEISYIGRQGLQDDPYRVASHPYIELNALAELRFGEIALFVNAVNLTNSRQTRYDPLLRPSPGPGGNPITEVWAPLEGRSFNAGVRAEL